MSWLAVGDWAEEMEQKKREERLAQLKLAAGHFGFNFLDVLGDPELEKELLARYEAAVNAADSE
jgi:hypothetical protein